MKPKSIINHNTVIPKNTSRYREEFDMISLPKANQYKITSITCKIDTTSLWNIRTDNTFKMVNNSNQTMTYIITPGYYSIDNLYQTLSHTIEIDPVTLKAFVSDSCKSIDLTYAPDIARIYHFEQKIYSSGSKSSEPYDISNGQNVIRIYSSIMNQTFGIKSSLIDNLIHVSIGLNNIITLDNLSIDVTKQSNLDYIEWNITDMYGNEISLNSNVYISFTISVY